MVPQPPFDILALADTGIPFGFGNAANLAGAGLAAHLHILFFDLGTAGGTARMIDDFIHRLHDDIEMLLRYSHAGK